MHHGFIQNSPIPLRRKFNFITDLPSTEFLTTLIFIRKLAAVLFMTINCCNGMALKKDAKEKSSDLKQDLEGKFNQTVEKVVETKTFLMDAVVFSINKTADVLLATKQHFKETKDSLKNKMSGSVSKTAQKLEELKEEIHGHKRAKTANSQAGQIVFVSRDFLVAPVFPIDEVPTIPFEPSTTPTKSVPFDISNPVLSSASS